MGSEFSFGRTAGALVVVSVLVTPLPLERLPGDESTDA
jgi:hypothetical protein